MYALLGEGMGKTGKCSCWEKGNLWWLMNSNVVKFEKFDHLDLVYHFIVHWNFGLSE